MVDIVPLLTKTQFDAAGAVLARCGMETRAFPLRMFGAYLDGELVGCGGQFDLTEDISWLTSVAVLKPYRRSGIGGDLVRAAMEDAARIGSNHMWLETLFWNLKFYRGLGFDHVPAKESPMGILEFRSNKRCSIMTAPLQRYRRTSSSAAMAASATSSAFSVDRKVIEAIT